MSASRRARTAKKAVYLGFLFLTGCQSGAVLLPASVPPASVPPDPILVGAGDIARCGTDGDEATASVLDRVFPPPAPAEHGIVFTLGDNAYDSGSLGEYTACYDPTWGRHRARTRPAAGNHEYLTAGAQGYFTYFGTAAGDPSRGYYGYDVGTWHVVALNSNCEEIGGCGAASPQETWLRADLAAHPTKCALAYWHHPLFSSGLVHGGDAMMKEIWSTLQEFGVDVALAGHEHNYERFAPQDAQGRADATAGIREFVVGTGGRSLYELGPPRPNSEVRGADYGVLTLTLHPAGYDWEFLPAASFADAGSGTCH